MLIVEIIPKYSLVVVDLLTIFSHVSFTSTKSFCILSFLREFTCTICLIAKVSICETNNKGVNEMTRISDFVLCNSHCRIVLKQMRFCSVYCFDSPSYCLLCLVFTVHAITGYEC